MIDGNNVWATNNVSFSFLRYTFNCAIWLVTPISVWLTWYQRTTSHCVTIYAFYQSNFSKRCSHWCLNSRITNGKCFTIWLVVMNIFEINISIYKCYIKFKFKIPINQCYLGHLLYTEKVIYIMWMVKPACINILPKVGFVYENKIKTR